MKATHYKAKDKTGATACGRVGEFYSTGNLRLVDCITCRKTVAFTKAKGDQATSSNFVYRK